MWTALVVFRERAGRVVAVVFGLDQAREPVARGEHDVEGGRHRADQQLEAGARALLRRGEIGHGPILATALFDRVRLGPMRISEIMTVSVVTARSDTPVREIATLMRDRNVGSVVIVDDAGHPCAMVTDRDLTIDVLAEAVDPAQPVNDFATSPVVTGETDMDLEEAAALMVSHRIRRLPVLASGELAGIVTLDDIAVRTGNLEVAQQMTAEVASAALPDFYFHERGG